MYQILSIAGSLGLFLFGMKIMSDGIQKTAGDKLKSILNMMTRNRFAAVFTGFFITALIQSSSATTVMIVSFVNAGLLNLGQAIGVIMGANIGTTITGWIVALLGFKFKITAMALPAIGIGLPFFFSKNLNRKDIGEILIGFGLLFLGLSFLKDSVPDIKSHPEILEFIQNFTGYGIGSMIFFVIIGGLITIIVQSSSAAMAITLTMAYSGWIDFPTAAAIVLGENIGTTVTAYLSSLGTSVNARRASRAHTLFNIFGVIWMLILFKPFLLFVDFIVPGDILSGSDQSIIPAHLAMFHSLFNITNTFIGIFFIPQIAFLVRKLVPDKGISDTEEYSFKYISTPIQDTPELFIIPVKAELYKLTEIVEKMFIRFWVVFNNPDKKFGAEVAELKSMEDYTDKMQEEITNYIIDAANDSPQSGKAERITALIRIVNELESIGDSCYSLILLAERRYQKKIPLNKSGIDDLKPYSEIVQKFVEFIKLHLNRYLSDKELKAAIELETEIDNQRKILRKKAQHRLQEGENVKGELLYIDMVRHMEHIGDYAMNIAEALRHLR
ncbi:MAG: Na/Pi cotransporter family protein [Spirochaetia bacterium]|nr:Na/Pi cotransporter family protein [Spirochaetia bacterium]